MAYDPYISEDQIDDPRLYLVGLPELLSRSDFVTLHVPPTAETRGMVDAEFIARIKPGAKLINTAFGGLIDESAAAAALKNGHLSGVALDVYAEEPPYRLAAHRAGIGAAYAACRREYDRSDAGLVDPDRASGDGRAARQRLP
ncbi:MAG: hypothetical protein HND48_01890 [Chloroflexi bacterium]|nr:hypothetical protein [Chloroflexota bacterium]